MFIFRPQGGLAMCYSAQIKAEYQKLIRHYGAIMSLQEFAEFYLHDPFKPGRRRRRPG